MLDGIDVFVKVVQAQSFSGAARRLNMPTTTVSAKVARLEKRLGVTLLHRTTRKLNLTEAGRQYFDHCARAMRDIEDGERQVAESQGDPQGQLRITATADMAQALLAPVLKTYLEQYPDVTVSLKVTNFVEDLVSENIDLALRIGVLKDSSLIARKYLDCQIGLWASPDYIAQHGNPRSIDDLKHHHVVGFSNRMATVTVYDTSGQRHIINLSPRLELDDVQTGTNFVEAGLGIGVFPDFANSMQATRNLVPVLPDYRTETYSAYFVYPQQRYVPLTVRKFIETALAQEARTNAG